MSYDVTVLISMCLIIGIPDFLYLNLILLSGKSGLATSPTRSAVDVKLDYAMHGGA